MADGERQRWQDRVLGYTDHVRMLWAAAPSWSILCLIATVVTVACNILTMIAVGQLVSGLAAVTVDGESADRLWRWFAIFATVSIVSQICAAGISMGNARVSAAYRIRIDQLLAETALHPRDLGVLESEEFSQDLESLTTNSRSWLLRFGMTGTWGLLTTRLTAVGSAAIVFAWHWWVAVIVVAVFVVSARYVRNWIDHLLTNIFEAPSDERRRAEYLSRLMVHPAAAKEIRLFGLSRWLERRYATLWLAFNEPVWRNSQRRLVGVGAVLVGQAAVIGGALALLGYDAFSGRVAIAAVTTTVIAILGLDAFGPLGDVESGLIRTTAFLRHLFALRRRIDLPELTLLPSSAASALTPGAAGIEIDELTFGYPSRDEPTLSRLSLSVPAGQSLAIVGVNGAGKSTLVKLLAGLYRPGSGTIRVDGRDPFGDQHSRGQVAVVFQDFVHYPLSLRDNVGFGALGHEDDQQLLDRALADAAGTEILGRVDGDWDTPLSKEFAGGTDLSGGQWQRVALARALAAVSGGAGVLVLDEPTAALDVRAEAEIFDRFLDMTHGVTTILVSHRLSTVRRADRIVVLDGETGQISEDGTHQELLRLGGAYAEMFTLQASRFAQAGAGQLPGESAS